MNVLILAAGSAKFNARDSGYPLCLTEVEGVPIVERHAKQVIAAGAKKIILTLRADDVKKFHLENVVRMISQETHLVEVPGSTGGAACTALIAIDHINLDDELLIINGDELLDMNFDEVLQNFRANTLDAGVVYFSSLHPRYSFIRLDKNGMVIEVAEKNPISKNALVGFFWFSKGSSFLRAVQNMIRKDARVNDSFYISPALNELILDGAKIGAHSININQYYPIKTERQLNDLNINHP